MSDMEGARPILYGVADVTNGFNIGTNISIMPQYVSATIIRLIFKEMIG